MSSRRSTAALVALIAVLGVGAVIILVTRFRVPAVLLFVLAVGIAAVERSRLARSLRAQDDAHRRRRWFTSAGLGFVALAVLGVAMVDLGGEEHWPMGRVLVYNVVFFGAAIAALATFVFGLRRPHRA